MLHHLNFFDEKIIPFHLKIDKYETNLNQKGKEINDLLESIIKGTENVNSRGSLASECSNLVLPRIVVILIYPSLKRRKAS